MSQLAYEEQGAALPGMKADSGFDDVASVVAEGAVKFGYAVTRGTDLEKQGRVPVLTGEVSDLTLVLGVALKTQAIESSDSGDPTYADKNMMSVMKEGRVYVQVQDTVTTASAVFVRFAGGNEGQFRSDADGGDAVALPNAKWVKGAGAGELAIVQLDL